MGNGMNKIVNGLYLGNYRDSRDIAQLSQNNITHILSVHDNAKAFHDDKVYLCLTASDSPSQDLAQYFSQCNDFIHKARLSGGNVLVHCLAGVSRSTTIVVAYVMSVTNLNYRQALDAVRGARSCASPNFGFQRQLVTFEIEKLEEERKRLSDLYKPPESLQQQDQQDCNVLLSVLRENDARFSRFSNGTYGSLGTSRNKESSSTVTVGACASQESNLSCSKLRDMVEELVGDGTEQRHSSVNEVKDALQDAHVTSSDDTDELNCESATSATEIDDVNVAQAETPDDGISVRA